MKNFFKYDKTSKISFYDENFDSKLLLEDELDNNQLHNRSNKSRFVITMDTLNKYIYISELVISKTKDGFIIENADESVLLINIGYKIYLLSQVNSTNLLNLKSMLYTFMDIYDCAIDVTKFKFNFKNEIKYIPLFRK